MARGKGVKHLAAGEKTHEKMFPVDNNEMDYSSTAAPRGKRTKITAHILVLTTRHAGYCSTVCTINVVIVVFSRMVGCYPILCLIAEHFVFVYPMHAPDLVVLEANTPSRSSESWLAVTLASLVSSYRQTSTGQTLYALRKSQQGG